MPQTCKSDLLKIKDITSWNAGGCSCRIAKPCVFTSVNKLVAPTAQDVCLITHRQGICL